MKILGKLFWNMIEHTLWQIVYKILRLNVPEKDWDAFIQFIKFVIVGISNTLIGYIIYMVSLIILRKGNIFPQTDIYIAQFVMFVLSVLWSFYWNNKAVFKKKEGEKRNWYTALLKTYVSYAFTCLFLSEALLLLWVKILGLSEYIAPALNLVITVPINFVIQKFWSFKKTGADRKNI